MLLVQAIEARDLVTVQASPCSSPSPSCWSTSPSTSCTRCSTQGSAVVLPAWQSLTPTTTAAPARRRASGRRRRRRWRRAASADGRGVLDLSRLALADHPAASWPRSCPSAADAIDPFRQLAAPSTRLPARLGQPRPHVLSRLIYGAGSRSSWGWPHGHRLALVPPSG